MTVADLMRRHLRTVSVDATVADVVQTLAAARVSALPVVDRLGRAVGVVSSRGVLKAQATVHGPVEREHLFQATRVLEIMEAWPPTIGPDAAAAAAAREMLRHGTQRLFVERAGALVGVISQTDLVAALAAGWPADATLV